MSQVEPLIVDMDSHVMEPPDLWQNYLEPKYRDRAIRIERDSEGVETLLMDDKPILSGRLAALGGAEHDALQAFTDPALSYLDGCPKASYDTAARVELLDEISIRAVNSYSGTHFNESPTLFFEFHGSEQGVEEQASLVQGITEENGGGEFAWTANTEDRNKMWRARHDLAYAIKQLRPGGRIWSTDVCVPISRLADCIVQTRNDAETSGILAPIAGHVGDGNFHTLLLVNHENPEEVAKANEVHERMVMRALSMDGTCTGEHGIGYGKIEFLKSEVGEAVAAMKLIKQSLDPNNIFNPGKICD